MIRRIPSVNTNIISSYNLAYCCFSYRNYNMIDWKKIHSQLNKLEFDCCIDKINNCNNNNKFEYKYCDKYYKYRNKIVDNEWIQLHKQLCVIENKYYINYESDHIKNFICNSDDRFLNCLNEKFSDNELQNINEKLSDLSIFVKIILCDNDYVDYDFIKENVDKSDKNVYVLWYNIKKKNICIYAKNDEYFVKNGSYKYMLYDCVKYFDDCRNNKHYDGVNYILYMLETMISRKNGLMRDLYFGDIYIGDKLYSYGNIGKFICESDDRLLNYCSYKEVNNKLLNDKLLNDKLLNDKLLNLSIYVKIMIYNGYHVDSDGVKKYVELSDKNVYVICYHVRENKMYIHAKNDEYFIKKRSYIIDNVIEYFKDRKYDIGVDCIVNELNNVLLEYKNGCGAYENESFTYEMIKNFVCSYDNNILNTTEQKCDISDYVEYDINDHNTKYIVVDNLKNFDVVIFERNLHLIFEYNKEYLCNVVLMDLDGNVKSFLNYCSNNFV